MKILLHTIIAGFLILLAFEKGFAADQCVACHENIADKESALFKHDIHSTKGVSCADCHGGNPNAEAMEQSMNPSAGFRGVPKGNDVSKTCARCHGDAKKMKTYGSTLPTTQWQDLQTSVHGKLSTTGQENIVQCTTCHHAHGIVSVKDPASPVYPLNVIKTCSNCHSNAAYMRTYNPSIAVDQLDKYRTSVHGKRNAAGDPKTAECASCHSSHNIRSPKDANSTVYPVNIPATCSKCHSDAQYMHAYPIPTNQYEKYAKSVHGVALLQKKDVGAPACNSCHGNHGANPPGVESVSKVCGTCHALNADLFSGSPHKKAFDEKHLPECETCHSNHEIVPATEALLGVAQGTTCSRCHTEKENVAGYRVAQSMRMLIDSLTHMESAARMLVEDAEQRGMEISEAKYKLRDIRQAYLQSRTTVHSFNEGKFREVVGGGIAVATVVQSDAKGAIDEYYFRRLGLGVSTLFITILAIALFLYIKKIEQ